MDGKMKISWENDGKMTMSWENDGKMTWSLGKMMGK